MKIKITFATVVAFLVGGLAPPNGARAQTLCPSINNGDGDVSGGDCGNTQRTIKKTSVRGFAIGGASPSVSNRYECAMSDSKSFYGGAYIVGAGYAYSKSRVSALCEDRAVYRELCRPTPKVGSIRHRKCDALANKMLDGRLLEAGKKRAKVGTMASARRAQPASQVAARRFEQFDAPGYSH